MFNGIGATAPKRQADKPQKEAPSKRKPDTGRAGAPVGMVPVPLGQRIGSPSPPSSPRASTTRPAPALRPRSPMDFATPADRQRRVRTYIESLGRNEFRTLLFRDLRGDMAAWAEEFREALAPAMQPVRKLLLERLAVLVPTAPATVDDNADAQSIARVGRQLCALLLGPAFHIPPLAMTMLAEVLARIGASEAVSALRLEEAASSEFIDGAIRRLLIQNSFLSYLSSGLPEHQAIAASKVLCYLKAVFRMNDTSRGATADIVRQVREEERIQADSNLAIIRAEAGRAAASTVELHWPEVDMDGSNEAAIAHARVKKTLFVDTWEKRAREHGAQLRRHPHHVLRPDGTYKRVFDGAGLADYLGCAATDSLPALILHVSRHLQKYVDGYLLAEARGTALGLRTGTAFKPLVEFMIRRDGEQVLLDYHGVDSDHGGPASRRDAPEESDTRVEDTEQDEALVRLEVRMQVRFRAPDLFQMHSALLLKTAY